MNGIEFVFNNQTVPILVLCVKTLCGIDLLSFNNLLRCILNSIDSFLYKNIYNYALIRMT